MTAKDSRQPDAGATPRTKLQMLEAVIEELNLDVSDPFTRMFANACALMEQRDLLLRNQDHLTQQVQYEIKAKLEHIEARQNLTQQIVRLERELAAISAPAGSRGWMQIETAPKDGSLILALNEHLGFMYVVGWRPADGNEPGHWDDVGSRHSAPSLYFNSNYFQRWHKLPPAPEDSHE